MLEYLVFLGAIVQIIGTVSYGKDVIRGTVKPNRVTWLLWSIAPIIGTAAAMSTGVKWSVLPVFMAGFGPLIIFIISFINKKSYWQLTKFDYLCGASSILALVLWLVTKQAEVAIIFAMLSDLFAAIPTIIKSWQKPETEIIDSYLAGLFGVFSCVGTLKMWTFSELAFPAYLIILNVLIVLVISRKNIFKYKR